MCTCIDRNHDFCLQAYMYKNKMSKQRYCHAEFCHCFDVDLLRYYLLFPECSFSIFGACRWNWINVWKGRGKKWLIQEYALITTLLFCGPLGGLPRTSVADARKQNSLDNNFRCGVTTHLEAIKLSTMRNWVYWKVFVLEALVGIVS